MNEPTKFAFWSYNLFPHFIGAEATGEVTLTNGAPKVYVPDYQGYFCPIHITTVEDGKEIDNKLYDLCDEYEIAKALLWSDYRAKALQVAPFLQNIQAYK